MKGSLTLSTVLVVCLVVISAHSCQFERLVSIWGPDYDFTGIIDTIKLSAELPRQRILKTHLSAEMLPNEFLEKKAKVR